MGNHDDGYLGTISHKFWDTITSEELKFYEEKISPALTEASIQNRIEELEAEVKQLNFLMETQEEFYNNLIAEQQKTIDRHEQIIEDLTKKINGVYIN